jgi:ELWxxDGT repeat protein
MKTNGTPAGTVMVANINPGPAGAFEYGSGMLTSFKDYLIFSANDGVHRTELWKTDGTTAGTSLLKDINPTSENILFSIKQVLGTL